MLSFYDKLTFKSPHPVHQVDRQHVTPVALNKVRQSPKSNTSGTLLLGIEIEYSGYVTNNTWILLSITS